MKTLIFAGSIQRLQLWRLTYVVDGRRNDYSTGTSASQLVEVMHGQLEIHIIITGSTAQKR